jgi:DNA-directed RNA polymerase subunit alpha
MARDLAQSIYNIATFSLGAYQVSEIRAFCHIYENLMGLFEELKKTESLATPDFINSGIEVLNFTQRTFNCLMAENIIYVKDLLEWSKLRLIKTPNLGRKSLKEIEDKLREKGLWLKEE